MFFVESKKVQTTINKASHKIKLKFSSELLSSDKLENFVKFSRMVHCHIHFVFFHNYYYYSSRVFHISISWWSFTRVNDRKSPQISRTLLSILSDLNNAVVWMVSTLPLISKSSSPFINPLVIVPRAPITIGINVIFKFHNFFNSLAESRYLFFFSFSFNFTLILYEFFTSAFAGDLSLES